MWSAVLLFGIAVNFEPNRLGLIALMLTRARPIPHLASFLGTAFLVSGTVGLLVLFVFHNGLFGMANLNGPLIQLGIGIVVLLLAATLAVKPSWLPDPRRASAQAGSAEDGSPGTARPRRMDLLATRVRDVAQGESRWFSGAAGAGMALPTIEYMALLALIIGSQTSALTQAAALFTFLLLGNVIGLIPIVGLLIVPDKTRQMVQRFNAWIRSRRRRDVVVLLGFIGAALVVAGATQL